MLASPKGESFGEKYKQKAMEDFEKKVKISEERMEVEENGLLESSSSKIIVDLLRRFLGVQQRRAETYAKLKRYHLLLIIIIK